MKQKVKDYLIENNLIDVNKVVAHIEELKASKGLPIEKKQMMFELIYYVYNDSSSLDSFFAENQSAENKIKRYYKIIEGVKFYDPMGVLNKNNTMTFLDEAIELSAEKENKSHSTRHKSKDGESHKEALFKDNPHFIRRKETEDFITTSVHITSTPEQAEKIKVIVNELNNQEILGKKEAYKETEGKLFYELDWNFITQMAERMSSNKKEGKYDLFNWKLPMTPKGIEDLKQATLRHLLEVLEGRYEDDGREFGHIEAISDNMMMLNYQLKNESR